MAEDVDAIAVDTYSDHLECPFEDPALQIRIAESLDLLEHLRAALQVRPRVVVGNSLPIELDLVDRADHVVERLPKIGRERRRDAEVVLDPNAQTEPCGVLEVSLDVVLGPQLVPPGIVVGHAVRPDRDTLRPALERHRAVGAVAVDVVIEERAHISGCPAQAASTIVQNAPDTSVCPPRSSGNGASRAASVNSRRGFVAMRSALKRYEAKRSSAWGRQPRCAKSTSMSNNMPSPSSPIFAKNSRGPTSS